MVRTQARRWIRRDAGGGELSGRLVTLLDPRSAASEAYRTLRANLIYAEVDTPPKAVLVTSPGPAEGKSTVCANLGVVLAQSGKSTLIIDCDFRRPVMHEIFGLQGPGGVAEVLAGEHDFQGSCQEPLPDLKLKVLTVGALPPNPAEFVASRSLSQLLRTAKDQFDHVLIDSPPMGQVSDPIVLATQVDGVLMILDAHKTRKVSLQRAVHNLNSVGARVLGTVMNNVDSADVYY